MKYLTLTVSLLALAFSVFALLKTGPSAEAGEALTIHNARAGAYAACNWPVSGDSKVLGKFNNINSKPITVTRVDVTLDYDLHCVLTFPFKVNNRVILVTPRTRNTSVATFDSTTDPTLMATQIRVTFSGSIYDNVLFDVLIF